MAKTSTIPPTLSAKDIDRFWSKIQKGPGCWLWTGSATRYGKIKVQRRNLLVHRVALFLATGDWPEVAMHHCDVKLCCRYGIGHILPGTQMDNIADRQRKGRQAHGERARRAKLTANDVRHIRLILGTYVRHQDIADKYGISGTTVQRIASNTNWKHIDIRASLYLG